MKITDIHVDGFGVWNGLRAEHLSSEMTVFFGHNEAGKTTLMQFIRAVLYGFSPERRAVYLPPVHGGQPGGSLSIANLQGNFRITRQTFLGDSATSLGKVSIAGINTKSHGQYHLNQLTSGIDESIFNNVFAVGIRELQELGTLNDTQAAEELYNLTSGVDRVSLVDVMRDLESARLQLLHPGEDSSLLARLLTRREALRGEIESLRGRGKRWCELSSERHATTTAIAELDQEIATLDRQSRLVEMATQIHDQWRARRRIARQLEQIGKVSEIPDQAIEQVEELNKQIDAQRAQLEELRKGRNEIRRASSMLPINRKLWAQSSRIDALCEYGPWIESLDRQVEELERDIAAIESQAIGRGRGSGRIAGYLSAGAPEVTDQAIQSLARPAREVGQARTRLQEARRRFQTSQQQENHLATRLEDQLGRRRGTDVQAALEDSGALVSQLRRRIQLEQRLNKLGRSVKELEQEKQEALDSRILPARMLFAFGGLFVLGVLVLLSGMMGWAMSTLHGEAAFILSFFGFGFSLLAIGGKLAVERSRADRLESCTRQLDRVRGEVDQVQQEGTRLDAELPSGSGPWEARLTAAEQELRDLEKMVPLNDDGDAAVQRSRSAKGNVEEAEEAYREARRKWKQALKQLGLPVTLSLKQVKQLGRHGREHARLRDDIDRRREQLENRRSERRSLVERVEQVVLDVGLETIAEEPRVRISELAGALDSQRELVRKRDELKRDYKQLRDAQKNHLQVVRKLSGRRQAVFDEAGVVDEEELRRRAELLERVAELGLKHEELTTHLNSIVGNHFTEQELEQELKDHEKPALEQRWDKLATRLQDAQGHLKSLHQRRGEVAQEMKLLAEDERLPAARLELNCVEQRIADSLRRWQVISITSRLLESIREIYESERQPETLAEASDYLERLSQGKYRRIWTPLTENVLRVDDAEGNSLSLEVLSRGTREAVFLSLRLALAAAYGRRGIRLPMVLDDVLVNLDARRAKATVDVLRQFAATGQQVLFFTCHDHIKQMFHEASVEVRCLPSHTTANAAVTVEEHVIQLPVIEQVEDVAEQIPAAADVVEPIELEESEDELEHEEALRQDVEADVEQPWDEVDEEDDGEYEDDEDDDEYEDEEEFDDEEYEDDEEYGESDDVEVEDLEDDEEEAEAAPVEAELEGSDEVYDDEDSVDEYSDDEYSDDDVGRDTTLGSETRQGRRFTWESPEMWVDERRGDAA